MAVTIDLMVRTNSDDAFVSWALSGFIKGCLGFRLERRHNDHGNEITEIVENRVGFSRDKPTSGEHRPSDQWPFQRFNWTDHAVDVGARIKYRVTAMLDTNGKGQPFGEGPQSDWTPWATLSPDAGEGFSCYFNRGLILSQFIARYLKDKKLSPAKLEAQLKVSVDPKIRAFLFGDLGSHVIEMLDATAADGDELHAALYELGDASLEDGLIKLGKNLNLILANGSDKSGDGNEAARTHLNEAGIATIDRLLGSKGLGHNKFVVTSRGGKPKSVWTGSMNWSTTGLCTQVNNGLLIEDADVAKHYQLQWDRIKDASPPAIEKAIFTPTLIKSNNKPRTFTVGSVKVEVRFTPTSDGSDMVALRDVINSAQHGILFLMFTPGPTGLHTVAGAKANEKGMYVRGVVSTVGNTKEDNEKNVVDVQLLSSEQKFKPDRYTIVQPQGIDGSIGLWIAEVTRRNFLSQIGHAIVHSKVLVIDPFSDEPIVVTGSHNFSASASKKNDENLVIIRGHKKLAAAYAAQVMSVYQHYRWRSYLREMAAAGKKPWSYLDDNDVWLADELKSKAIEIGFWR